MTGLADHMERVWVITCGRCSDDGIQYGTKPTAERQFDRSGWRYTAMRRVLCPACYHDLNP